MGPALGYPWKGLFYLKPYKLKVSKVPKARPGLRLVESTPRRVQLVSIF
jgi:hypothetical protein